MSMTMAFDRWNTLSRGSGYEMTFDERGRIGAARTQQRRRVIARSSRKSYVTQLAWCEALNKNGALCR